jgi:ParB family chromosome partitioning protein
MSYDEIAKKVGKDSSTIINTTRLLNLPLEAKRAVAAGTITEGHARQILAVPAERQNELLELIIKNGWTVRQTEAFVRDFKQVKTSKDKALERSSSTNDLTKGLADYLGTKVSMQRTAKGGKLLIEFYSDEELDRIFNAIKN